MFEDKIDQNVFSMQDFERKVFDFFEYLIASFF
jgi:hypothetical protein